MSDWKEAQNAALSKEYVDKIGLRYKDPVVDCQWITWKAGRIEGIKEAELAAQQAWNDTPCIDHGCAEISTRIRNLISTE